MNAFTNAVAVNQNRPTKVRTANGAKAFDQTGDAVLNYFSTVGARRGQDNVPLFLSAFAENEDLAIRALLWSRDIRNGAGERETFRQVFAKLAILNIDVAKRVLARIPELGRWDDALIAVDTPVQSEAFAMVASALRAGDGLCAKWMPRKGKVAEKLRAYLDLTPKQYRKTLVNLTKVVETQMCAKQWDEINFSHVPSVASLRYREAFKRNAKDTYQEYLNKLTTALTTGEDTGVKVNAAAVYPHQIVASIMGYGVNVTLQTIQLANAQWEALPNYVPEGSSVLPMVDVSGSMTCPAGGNKSIRCLDVSIALGVYLAAKNTGPFKDVILNFSTKPELMKLQGNTLYEKVKSINMRNWQMSTDLEAAFAKILDTAKKANVPQEDMPKTLVIFSDMQFDHCVSADTTLFKNMKNQYKAAGYELPNVVFWNLNDSGNQPVKADSSGAALVSGFSPSLMENVLKGNLENLTPYNMMLDILMKDRYSF